jgi:hypothetical protein
MEATPSTKKQVCLENALCNERLASNLSNCAQQAVVLCSNKAVFIASHQLELSDTHDCLIGNQKFELLGCCSRLLTLDALLFLYTSIRTQFFPQKSSEESAASQSPASVAWVDGAPPSLSKLASQYLEVKADMQTSSTSFYLTDLTQWRTDALGSKQGEALVRQKQREMRRLLQKPSTSNCPS